MGMFFFFFWEWEKKWECCNLLQTQNTCPQEGDKGFFFLLKTKINSPEHGERSDK